MDRKIIRKKKRRPQFTKIWTEIILFVALLDIQFCFLLAAFDKVQIAESLGIALVTEVIGVFIAYCCKSYKETKEEESIKLQRDELGLEDEETKG